MRHLLFFLLWAGPAAALAAFSVSPGSVEALWYSASAPGKDLGELGPGEYRLRLGLPVGAGRFSGAVVFEEEAETGELEPQFVFSLAQPFMVLGHFNPRGVVKDLLLPRLNRDLPALARESSGFAPDRSYTGASRVGAAVFLPGDRLSGGVDSPGGGLGDLGLFFYTRKTEETAWGGWASWTGGGFTLSAGGVWSLPRQRLPGDDWIKENLRLNSPALVSGLVQLDFARGALGLGLQLRGAYAGLDGPGGFVRAQGAWNSGQVFLHGRASVASPYFFNPDGSRLGEFLALAAGGRIRNRKKTLSVFWEGEENHLVPVLYPRGGENFRPMNRFGTVGLSWRRPLGFPLALSFQTTIREEGDSAGNRTGDWSLEPLVRWERRGRGLEWSAAWTYDREGVLTPRQDLSFWTVWGAVHLRGVLTLRGQEYKPKFLCRIYGDWGPWGWSLETCLNREPAKATPEEPGFGEAPLTFLAGGNWDLRLGLKRRF